MSEVGEDAKILGEALLADGLARLSPAERKMVARIVKRLATVPNPNEAYDRSSTLGGRMADRVAAVGGSWAFVGGFAVFLAIWAVLNLVLLPVHDRFDPYPFIFLNLMLSMLAAIQAPIIMMSQNRQAARDRSDAQLDYEVNTKAEAEIAHLCERVEALAALIETRTGKTT